ncbi:MAG: protein translocase subunit SecD [Candidatus Firestonebacteria bacterium]
MHRNRFVVGLILLVFFGSIYAMFFKGTEFSMPFSQDSKNSRIKLGLDLQGGIHLVYEVDEAKLTPGLKLEGAVERAIEIIRNRIDALGVVEPFVQREGEKWIVVQLPGVKNVEEAKKLIGQTALLEFKLVSDDKALRDKANEGKVPDGYEILYLDKSAESIVVKKEPLMTGESLKDAQAKFGFGTLGNEAMVSMELNKEGAKQFADLTGKYKNRRIAIVLDGTCYSAPEVRERIPNGHAQITGSFDMSEANKLAIVLRSGSLPAPLNIISENVVGPTLGQDSIRKGQFAGFVGIVAIMLLMGFYYKVSGIIANIGLLCNLLYLLGAMAILGASFTMPGIAGVILTMGMSVDSNVLIFERIREELRAGKTVRAAVDQGYKKAFWTIFDSHVTTLITSVILFMFGTGPVRGFAVTLSLGVLISLFTALIVTKVVFDWRLARGEAETLSI